jgi:hypothetical protein
MKRSALPLVWGGVRSGKAMLEAEVGEGVPHGVGAIVGAVVGVDTLGW